jgi:hypothetical protein
VLKEKDASGINKARADLMKILNKAGAPEHKKKYYD